MLIISNSFVSGLIYLHCDPVVKNAKSKVYNLTANLLWEGFIR